MKISFREVLQITKKNCIALMNKELRNALRTYHALSDISQEELAVRMQITPRACSGLENGEYGFSIFSTMALFSLLSPNERFSLFAKLCAIMAQMLGEAA